MSQPIFPFLLDDYFQTTHIGSVERAISNNLYGVNHRQTPNMVPSNKDTYGLCFFVRPQLNMQGDNIRNLRQFSSLLTKEMFSIQQYVRCMLDPRQQAGYAIPGNTASSVKAVTCGLVDNMSPFIPILTNNIVSMSGWPDVTQPTFTSKEGLYKEVWSIADGVVKNYETFDLDCTFRNTRGDPIVFMFYIWLHYQAAVFEGKLVPYLDMISENEIDYNTRIYRLVLDKNKNKVTKIGATGIAFPISVPTGGFFDFNANQPYNDQNKEFSVRFKCVGAEFFDDVLIYDFNKTVCYFNEAMKDAYRETYMTRIPNAFLGVFNNRGYPRINPKTYELEWWVGSNYFAARTADLSSTGLIKNVRLYESQTYTGD